MSFVILVEVVLKKGYAIEHLNYTPELISTYPEYFFFQDMLKSNIRYNISFFLGKMINDGWIIAGQSQDKHRLVYTLVLNKSPRHMYYEDKS